MGSAGPESAEDRDRAAAVTQLGYVGLDVSNLGAWRDFAEKVLGLQFAAVLADGAVQYRTDAYPHRVTLIPSGGDGLAYAGWECRDDEAMAAIARAALAAGANVTSATTDLLAARGVLGLIRFEDPDGLALEVFHSVRLDHTQFVSPRGMQFVAGEMGLGHIVLRTENLERTVDFYRRVLGVRISDLIIRTREGRPHVVTFAHVNERHHSIALTSGLKAQGRGAEGRLSHLMLEVSSLDEVGHTFDLAQSLGLRTNHLGRHSNDRMVSFYVESPSGFNVEFGFGGVRISDPGTWVVRHYGSTSEWGHGPLPTKQL